MANVAFHLHGASGQITVDPLVFYEIFGQSLVVTTTATNYILETPDGCRIVLQPEQLPDGVFLESATPKQLETFIDNECALQ